jgi:hypothetical protein
MRIAVFFPGKIGDALFASSSIRYLATKHPHASIDWIYGSPMLTEFVTKCLKHTDLPVTNYIPHDCPYTQGQICGWEWGKINWESVFPDYDAYYNLSLRSYPEPGCHLIEWIGVGGGLIRREERLPNPALIFKSPPSQEAKDKVLVHAWIPAVERQSKSLAYLKPTYAGHQLHSIGHPDENMVPNTLDLRGMDYGDYIDHLRSARLVVGVCSASVALAAALGTPAIMVHNVTRPDNGGIARFGEHAIDLVKPFVYDIDRAIENALEREHP